jgi:hypothetical protein
VDRHLLPEKSPEWIWVAASGGDNFHSVKKLGTYVSGMLSPFKDDLPIRWPSFLKMNAVKLVR